MQLTGKSTVIEKVIWLSWWNHPMDTSSRICHWFYVEIPRGKFVEITSILKGESSWKLWDRIDVDISTWIWLSKSTKYWWVLDVDFSMSFWRQIDVLTVSILSFSNIFLSGLPILNYSGIMLSHCNFNNIEYWRNQWFWNYWNYILWEYCNNANK